MIGLRAVSHGLADLRAYPGRAALTGLSLTIGVLAMVAIFTVGSITADVFIAAEEQHNGRLVTVQGQVELPHPGPAELRAALAAATPVADTGGAAVIIARPTSVTGVAHPSQLAAGAAYSHQALNLVAGDLTGVRRLPRPAAPCRNGRNAPKRCTPCWNNCVPSNRRSSAWRSSRWSSWRWGF